jgi:hypothetical protein
MEGSFTAQGEKHFNPGECPSCGSKDGLTYFVRHIAAVFCATRDRKDLHGNETIPEAKIHAPLTGSGSHGNVTNLAENAARCQCEARRADRQRRTSKPVVEGPTGVDHKARRSPVPGAGSRPRCRLNRAATGPYIARTVTTPGRARAVGEIAGLAVSRQSHGRGIRTQLSGKAQNSSRQADYCLLHK